MVNYGSSTLRLNTGSVDGLTGATTGSVYASSTTPPQGAGAWVTVPTTSISVAPGQTDQYEGSLNKQLAEWGGHIRLLRNAGAHPGSDGLESVSKDEASDVMAFLEQLLSWTYVMPAKLAEARTAHTSHDAG